MIRLALSVALTLTALTYADVPQSLDFKKLGQPVKKLSLDELKQIAKPRTLEVFEFQNQEKRSYEVLPLTPVLDKVYGAGWRQSEDVLFTCADGYQPIVPVSEFAKHEAFLAFAVTGGGEFSILSKIHENKVTALGPFYLVWNNLGNDILMAQGPNFWPFQLTTVDLVRFSDKFAKLAPPPNASQRVREGFTLFRKNCLSCHTLNGEGGQTSGVELNRPVSVTAYWKRDMLAKWIENSKALRETSKMPLYELESGYRLPEKVRRTQIDNIIRYLEAMAPSAKAK